MKKKNNDRRYSQHYKVMVVIITLIEVIGHRMWHPHHNPKLYIVSVTVSTKATRVRVIYKVKIRVIIIRLGLFLGLFIRVRVIIIRLGLFIRFELVKFYHFLIPIHWRVKVDLLDKLWWVYRYFFLDPRRFHWDGIWW